MAEIFTENQKLLIRYLAAVGCDKLAGLVIITELWEEEAVLEMLEYCRNNPDASQAQLLKASSKISSKFEKQEQTESEAENWT